MNSFRTITWDSPINIKMYSWVSTYFKSRFSKGVLRFIVVNQDAQGFTFWQ